MSTAHMPALENAFAGRTAFITGAASGIGLELTRQLLPLGCNVMMSDIDGDALARAAETLAPSNAGCAQIRVDVSDSADLEKAAAATVERFGAVHHVFNNAGVGAGASPGKTDMRDWRWIVDINLMGVVHGVEIFAPHILKNAPGADGLRGHFINTASMAGHMTMPGMAPYHATKFAVVGYTEALRQELEPHQVGVTALCPTFVKTQIHTTGRNAPSAGGDVNTDDPMYKIASAMVAHGMEVEPFITMVLRGVAANRCHVFNDPIMKDAFGQRHAALMADLDAGLADMQDLGATPAVNLIPTLNG